MHYTIYKITNLLNNRYYIGKHKTNNLSDRYMGSGSVIRYAIKKYGRDNFMREHIFFAFDEESMNWAEEQLVVTRDEDSLSYNIQKGGKGGNPPRNDVRGEKNPMYGKYKELNHNYGKIWITNGIDQKFVKKDDPIPDGWYRGMCNSYKEFMSKKSSGKNNPMYGRIPSEYQRQQTREANKIVIDIQKAQQLYDSGMNIKELAKHFNVCHTTIEKIGIKLRTHSDAMKNRYINRPMSTEHKNKLSISAKNRKNQKRTMHVYNDEARMI